MVEARRSATASDETAVDSVWIDEDGTRVGEVAEVVEWEDIGVRRRKQLAKLASLGWIRFFPPPVVRTEAELARHPPEIAVVIRPFRSSSDSPTR